MSSCLRRLLIGGTSVWHSYHPITSHSRPSSVCCPLPSSPRLPSTPSAFTNPRWVAAASFRRPLWSLPRRLHPYHSRRPHPHSHCNGCSRCCCRRRHHHHCCRRHRSAAPGVRQAARGCVARAWVRQAVSGAPSGWAGRARRRSWEDAQGGIDACNTEEDGSGGRV